MRVVWVRLEDRARLCWPSLHVAPSVCGSPGPSVGRAGSAYLLFSSTPVILVFRYRVGSGHHPSVSLVECGKKNRLEWLPLSQKECKSRFLRSQIILTSKVARANSAGS
ncbi:hypothetical protein PVAP13_2KG583150 [Panicum virgatum]|uniref:Uncharacterized protein n=1 Tax=Panicum virgatum TaxID=38727 RepID=A0A8T0WI28_PANVG|nr:hypothetical protein PVAP13_2KG583150 [Panicum virgatum]